MFLKKEQNTQKKGHFPPFKNLFKREQNTHKKRTKKIFFQTQQIMSGS